jgi:hypothetical protein
VAKSDAACLRAVLAQVSDARALVPKQGPSPLHVAAQLGQVELVALLLAHGAPVNAEVELTQETEVEKDGRLERQTTQVKLWPLDLATAHEPVTKLLESKGAKHGPSYQRAQALNEQGFAAYKKGKLDAAVGLFEQSLAVGVPHYTAQFNLACACARLAVAKKGGACNPDWFTRALAALDLALAQNPERTRQKAQKDSDFDGVRGFPAFVERVTGTTFATAKHLAPYVVGKTYKTSCPGSAYCPVRTLRLDTGGTFTSSVPTNGQALLDCMAAGCAKMPKELRATQTGPWRLDGRAVVLRTKQGEERLVVASPGKLGDLFFPDPNDMSDEKPATCAEIGLSD